VDVKLAVGYFLAENRINANHQDGDVIAITDKTGILRCKVVFYYNEAIVYAWEMLGWKCRANVDLNHPDSLDQLLKAVKAELR
jgi:hypothetical protein